MSTLSDLEYAKYNALIHSKDDLGQLKFDGIKFLEFRNPGFVHRYIKQCIRFAAAIWRFLGECLKESPASYNERARRSHYDCPPTRGIY